MVPVILTSAAWYIIPKGIEYSTTDCGANPQSKIDRIRTRLFGYKGVLENLAYSNSLTKSIYKLVQRHYPYMSLAVLITPGVKALPFITAANGFVQMAVCYTLHVSLRGFVKSNHGIKWMASLPGLRILNSGVGGLGFIQNALLKEYAISSNDAIKQMVIVLKLRLKPSDAYEFLRAKGKKDLLSIIERVKCYKSAEEMNSLTDLMRNKFSETEEDWLESLPLQIREKLVKASGLNRSILDRLICESDPAGDFCRDFQNSIYARAIVELKIDPQQYDSQEIEEAIMNACPIPSAFDMDITLQSYICSITHKPIRYPVEDPTQQDQDNPKLYEKSAIENHLKSYSTSPLTKEPLTTDQLIPRQDIQDVIEMKLDHYSSNIWNYLETNPFS